MFSWLFVFWMVICVKGGESTATEDDAIDTSLTSYLTLVGVLVFISLIALVALCAGGGVAPGNPIPNWGLTITPDPALDTGFTGTSDGINTINKNCTSNGINTINKNCVNRHRRGVFETDGARWGAASGPYTAPQVPQQQEQVTQSLQPPQPSAAPIPVVAPTPQPPPAPPAAPPAPPAAPPAPPAPPAPGAPPAPPPPVLSAGAPPAPPPPPAAGTGSDDGAPTGLAAALQAAKLNKLKKVEPTDGESAISSNTSNRPPIGGGPIDHMSELQKKILLRANKASAEVVAKTLNIH